MYRSAFAVILILLGVHTFTITEVAQAQPPINVSIDVLNDVHQGKNFEVLINVDPQNQSISGIQSHFSYDPHVFIINSITEGNLFKQKEKPTLFSSGNYSYGIVYNMWSVMLCMCNTSKPGTFAIINLTAVKTGSFNLNISHVMISDPISQLVPLQTFNTTVFVKSYPRYDVIEDGTVNILDINFVAQHFGEIIN